MSVLAHPNQLDTCTAQDISANTPYHLSSSFPFRVQQTFIETRKEVIDEKCSTSFGVTDDENL
jgi:hypothetical protein